VRVRFQHLPEIAHVRRLGVQVSSVLGVAFQQLEIDLDGAAQSSRLLKAKLEGSKKRYYE
jgi:hypothetical protein